MKKLLYPFLFLILVLFLVACGAEQTKEPAPTETEGTTEQAAPEAAKPEKVTIQAPSGISITAPLYKLNHENLLAQGADEVEFLTWKTPDELRARISSGQAEISAVPTYVGANLYNKDVDVKLINTLIWGILYVIGPEGETFTWEDMKGKTIHVPFKNDMPDLVFRYLLKENGIAETDMKIEYTATPQEVVQLLAAGQAEYAILPEHTASLAVAKAKKEGKNLQKIGSLQEEWAIVTGKEPRIPQAGIIANGSLIEEHPEFIALFQEQLAASVANLKEDPAGAAEIIAQYQEGLEPKFIENLLPYLNIEFVSAQDAKEELEFFFEKLATLSPDIIGGKLPDDEFYYEP